MPAHDDETLARLSAATAIQAMMTKGWLDICTIDKCARLLGRIPDADARNILAPIHCVNFADMPEELRSAIPELIGRCLSIEWPPAPEPRPRPGEMVIVPADPPPRRRLLRLLQGRERG